MDRKRTEAEVVTVAICDSEKPLEEATHHWINEQINRRRRDNVPVCVRVTITKGGIDMILSTPGFTGGGGGGRPPREQEKEIFALWDKRNLNHDDFTGGNLIAFLNQIKDLI